MWLDTPQTLRQQIRDDIRQHRTPAGCVKAQPRAKRLSHPERDDVAGDHDPKREDAVC